MRALHVGIRVTDLKRSVTFYTALGYEVVGDVPGTEFGNLTMLKLPGDEFVSLELVDASAHGHVDPGGLSQLVIHAEALHATVAHLRARGVEVEPPTSPDGSKDFLTAWLTDPDGYRIELVQWPAGHEDGMTDADFEGTRPPHRSRRSAKAVVAELFQRQQAGDPTALDDLVAEGMVNHAAGDQGRDGLKRILRALEADLGPVNLEQHQLVGEGDLVAQYVTLRGTHRASTMPLLADAPVSGRSISWTFHHLWRVADGMIVEHWACRDDLGLLEQLRV